MSQQTLNIFSTRINARLMYICHEVFGSRMGLTPLLYTDQEAFENASGLKLNYSSEVMDEVIPSIQPADLLFEKRIQHQDHDAKLVDGMLLLYPIKGHPLGFDPLAASFFHLSRYEEYMPHRKDVHGRFEEDEALLVKMGSYGSPQVERYAQALSTWLKGFYPSIEFASNPFEHLVTFDIDQLYAQKQKGIIRTAVGLTKALFNGSFLTRLRVLLGKVNDPNDIYDALLSSCKEEGHSPIFFLQVGEGSRFDHNNPPHLSAVKDRMNTIALRARVGIHPSYFSSDNPQEMKKEVERLRNIVATRVVSSRQHYLKFALPGTFRVLQELGITDDYSIGYTERNGFRAGTCNAFRAYDLEREDILDITLHPNTFMDLAAVRAHIREEEAVSSGLELLNEVKTFGGQFISVWHPEVLTGQSVDYPSMNLFRNLVANA